MSGNRDPQDIYHLLPGIGVVIDDQIENPDGEDSIHNLVAQLEQHGVPLVKYSQLPPERSIQCLANIAFILLDWELLGRVESVDEESGLAVIPGSALEGENRKSVVDFLHALKSYCFAPVFLLSNLDTASIKRTLSDESLPQHPDRRAHIFVHSKSDLKTEGSVTEESPLLRTLSGWITSHPALYVIAYWRLRMNAAQTHLFWDLFAASPGWPRALWNASKDDGDNPDYALCEILMRSMKAEMEPLGLDENIVIGSDLPDADQSELRAILERTMVVPNNKLPQGQYACGDLFRRTFQGVASYRLNIRCDCDCIPHTGTPDDIELYLLKASIVSEEELHNDDVFSATSGFARPMHRAYIFPVDHGKCLAVKFTALITDSIKKIQDGGWERIGRLTSPHLTDIRHRYSNFLHREGFPKIPLLAVRGSVMNTAGE